MIRFGRLLGALVLIGTLFCASRLQAADFTLFGVVSGGSSTNANTLVTVDPSTGGQEFAGPVGRAHGTNIDWNPVTRTLFASNVSDNPGVIEEIDPATGVAKVVATIRESNDALVAIGALAFDSSGNLYGVAGESLGVIDLTKGTFSPLFPLPKGVFVVGIDFSPDGVLYAVCLRSFPTKQTLVTIDLAEQTSIERDIVGTLAVGDIDYAPDGNIYHSNFSFALVRIDPKSGKQTVVGFGSVGALSGVASIPINYTLASSGIIISTQGGAGTTTITATLISGTTQGVSFSASGLPSGATAEFSPGACSPTCTSQLTISTSGSTSTGTFPISVTGSPLGKTTIVTLVVNAPPFDYTLANSGAITVASGGSGATTLTATLTAGAPKNVSFSAAGLPSGATAEFSPGACSPTCTSQLTISTSGSTSTGTFPITVTGSPLGITTSFTVVVQPPVSAGQPASVLSVSGSVLGRVQGAVLPITPATLLGKGMQLETGPDGEVTGGCDDGTVLTVGPNSRVFFEDSPCHPAETRIIDLTQGPFNFVSGQTPSQEPSVRTPVSLARAGDTGADFTTMYSQDGSTGTAVTMVQTGEVTTRDAATGNVVVLRPGQQGVINGPLPVIGAAVLPSGRSVQVGNAAAAFATILNAGATTATVCELAAVGSVPAEFTFQTTDPQTNAIIRTRATPVSIPAQGLQTFVFAFTPFGDILFHRYRNTIHLRWGASAGHPRREHAAAVGLIVSRARRRRPRPHGDEGRDREYPRHDRHRLLLGGHGQRRRERPDHSHRGHRERHSSRRALTLSDESGDRCVHQSSHTGLERDRADRRRRDAHVLGLHAQGTENVPFLPGVNRVFVRFKTASGATVGATSVAVRTQ